MINKNSYGLVAQFIYRSLKFVLFLFLVLMAIHFTGYYLIDKYFPASEIGFKNHFYKDIIFFGGLTLCFIAYIVFMIKTVKNSRDYISYLIEEVHTIENGDYRSKIKIKGNDEITHLASRVEKLREQMLKEHDFHKKKYEKQSQIITSISHDLRTPLTTLSGYLEILNESDLEDEILKKRYLKKALARSLQLEDLIDTAFEYFYLTDNELQGIQLLRCNSYINLIDILNHSAEYISQNGFSILRDIKMYKVALFYDVRLMERLFDNVFTNIKRYGDKNMPVKIEAKFQNNEIKIKIINKIDHNIRSKESTGIGIKNCKKIMKNHKGSFFNYLEDEFYIAEIRFPIKNKETA